jgi:hypothetical protein
VSDQELDPEELLAEQHGDCALQDEKMHWEQNNPVLLRKLVELSSSWVSKMLFDSEYIFVWQPTVSRIASSVTHPRFYPSQNLSTISDMNELARMLLPVRFLAS